MIEYDPIGEVYSLGTLSDLIGWEVFDCVDWKPGIKLFTLRKIHVGSGRAELLQAYYSLAKDLA